MQKEIICISCPMGCRMSVTLEAGKVKEVTGATCKKGVDYAGLECTNPMRIVTSTVPITGSALNTLPVKTQHAIPKGKIMDCMRSLKGITVAAPVLTGDMIVENVCGTGINIVATRSSVQK